MDLELLDRTLADAGEPGFRARQAWRWTAGGARRLRGDDRPAGAAARAAWRRRSRTRRCRSLHEAHSRDGTVKALFQTHDGRPVEAVLMRYRDGRRSVCVSSQSGCPLTCTFCATGAMKFGRNLTASRDPRPGPALPPHRAGQPPRLHGDGRADDEPRQRARARRGGCPTSASPTAAPASPRSAGRRASAELTESDMPIRLALSLHAPEDALRSKIMPVNERFSIAEVLEACERLLRAPPPQGLRRVRDARRGQRLLRARPSRSRSCSTRASTSST